MRALFTNFIYHTELQDVAKLFFFEVEMRTSKDEADICLTESVTEDGYVYIAEYDGFCDRQEIGASRDAIQDVRLRKRFAKIALYRALQKATGKAMAWGSLTGIRPTKLARQLVKEGADWKKTFTNLLSVSKQKTDLVDEILTQQGALCRAGSNTADLYVGIPFCVTRCSYCSFTSGEIERLKKYVEPYIDALCKDITETVNFARNSGIELKNVYFGGGTPTSLAAEQLDRIMSCIDFNPSEYTIEAGRPDTVSEAKLHVLAEHGVDRISVNPQTFNQSVLDIIGRKHTVDEIYKKYELAKKFGFTVNMDLIAGLPSETNEMFRYSIDEAVRLSPDNITVHTLALKRGSILKEQNYYTAAEQDVADMIEYAHGILRKSGYSPYYMYRQKYMAENLENVGFCKAGTACLYNIGIMEEITDILACGTNAISKRIFADEDRIERAANAKDVITYIEKTDEYIARKFNLFKR